MMACSDPNNPFIQKQVKELKNFEVPGDVNIAIARVLDEYPTQQLAESEISMKQAVKERRLQWSHFFPLDNDKHKADAPVGPFQVSNW